MLRVTLFEVFIRGLPEGFLSILAAYAFSKRYIDIKRYIVSSIIYVIMIYAIRFLPINFGVHTILNFFVFITLIVNINKINLIDSIRAVITTLIIQFMCEAINMLMIQYIFKADVDYILSKPVLKVIYGIPGILLFAGILISYYVKLLKRKELKFS